MAAKRLRDDDCDDDQEDQTSKLKRMRTGRSFASVIREVVMKNFFDNMCSTLEPLIRKVVSEEVEDRLRARRLDWIPRSCPTGRLDQIAANEECQVPMNLKLRFIERLSLPIFTGTKILDIHNNPLQIILDGHDHHQYIPPCSSIRVEILVLDGDFLGTNHNDTWTDDEFSRYIVRERTGKRPLIAGESKVTLWNGIGAVGDIEFTDNSSWIRSRRFRLGARVVKIQGGNGSQSLIRVREAVTEPFVVKDHRGELYKKHHPPALEDEVWRLEKIGKGGAFHQKLAYEGIHTVQDFLKLFTIDSTKLRNIMGAMSNRIWEATLKHAKTCVMGTKLYRCHGDNYILTINPICQLVKIEINGQIYSENDFKRIQGAYIQRLVKDAYTKWNCLEEFDSQAHNTAQLLLTHKGAIFYSLAFNSTTCIIYGSDLIGPELTCSDRVGSVHMLFLILIERCTGEMEGDSYNCGEQMSIMCYGGDAYLTNGICEVDTMSSNEEGGCSEWGLNSGFSIGHGGY